MPSMTTTKNGFRVDDITFRGARKQSEIENEIEKDEVEEVDVKAPVSLTPEQVKDYYKTKIALAKDSNEKRVYSQTIRWIDELLDTKKRLVVLEEKQRVLDEDGDAEETLKDISESM